MKWNDDIVHFESSSFQELCAMIALKENQPSSSSLEASKTRTSHLTNEGCLFID